MILYGFCYQSMSHWTIINAYWANERTKSKKKTTTANSADLMSLYMFPIAHASNKFDEVMAYTSVLIHYDRVNFTWDLVICWGVFTQKPYILFHSFQFTINISLIPLNSGVDYRLFFCCEFITPCQNIDMECAYAVEVKYVYVCLRNYISVISKQSE